VCPLQPYRRQKAHEERSATDELVAILACVADALLNENAAVNREAAIALLSFTQAVGFDSPAQGAGSDLASAWVFHQQLLLRADCCAQVVLALRQHVVRALREWSPSAGSAVLRNVSALAQDSEQQQRHGGERSQLASQPAGLSKPPPPPPQLRRMPEIVRALLQARRIEPKRPCHIPSHTLCYSLSRVLHRLQILREMSESPECVAALVVAGLPVLCVDLLRSAVELHDPATQVT
jgi:hypothetical protein